MSTWEILVQYRQGLLSGLIVTGRLCLIIWLAGLLLGTFLGALGARYPRSAGRFSRAGSFLLTGIPVLVLLFWLHYPAQSMLGVQVEGFVTAAFALTLVNTFIVADTVQEALATFPRDYREAALVLGMKPNEILWFIELPLIFRRVTPSLLLSQVSMLQATLFASLISVDEVFRIAQRINAEVYRPIQIYTALAILFLLLCLPINGLALILEKKFRARLGSYS